MINPKLSIIIPFYNEEKNISLVLDTYANIETSIHFELICVNNGSTDNSAKVFENFLKKKQYKFAKVITVKKNIGYGYGIMSGIRQAKGEVLAWTHADMQTDPQDVFRAYEVFKKANNIKIIVTGRRVKRPVSQFIFSLGMAMIASFYLRKIFYEINAQPKLFPRSFLPHLENAPDDFSLDLYFLNQCKKYTYTIKTIPVLFKKRIHGESKWAYSFASKKKTIIRTIQYIITTSI